MDIGKRYSNMQSYCYSLVYWKYKDHDNFHLQMLVHSQYDNT